MMEPAPRSRLDANRACNGKIAWGTRTDAVEAARRQSEDFGSELEPYPCPHCGMWHTGNVPKWLQLDREHGVFQAPQNSH